MYKLRGVAISTDLAPLASTSDPDQGGSSSTTTEYSENTWLEPPVDYQGVQEASRHKIEIVTAQPNLNLTQLQVGVTL